MGGWKAARACITVCGHVYVCGLTYQHINSTPTHLHDALLLWVAKSKCQAEREQDRPQRPQEPAHGAPVVLAGRGVARAGAGAGAAAADDDAAGPAQALGDEGEADAGTAGGDGACVCGCWVMKL